MQSKVNNKFSSNLKSSKINSRVKDETFGDSSVKNSLNPMSDTELSRKY